MSFPPARSAAPPRRSCRFCSAPLQRIFVDLGSSPLCQSILAADELDRMEPFYPLTVFVCDRCFLVQLGEYVSPESIFSHYAYFSSYSDSWLRHARTFAEEAVERFALGDGHLVAEVASNDGYLLQYFLDKGVEVLGIEPAANVAEAALARGVPTTVRFFGTELAQELVAQGKRADLLIGNNVFAHVPDLNDFAAGLALFLAPGGVLSLEFPHLQRLIEGRQFDTIYHEHFSYFSFAAAERVLAHHGLHVFDVQELPTHGGSLRLSAAHAEAGREPSEQVHALRRREHELGYDCPDAYASFDEDVRRTKRALLRFLIEAKEAGKSVVGYGAPGKGNTLLNYCGIRADFLDFTVDRNPFKQGKYLPGSRIPVHPPERLFEARPDYVLVLPWNLREEIMGQLAAIRAWGGRFAIPIPELTLYD